jgi:hypothetical protein
VARADGVLLEQARVDGPSEEHLQDGKVDWVAGRRPCCWRTVRYSWMVTTVASWICVSWDSRRTRASPRPYSYRCYATSNSRPASQAETRRPHHSAWCSESSHAPIAPARPVVQKVMSMGTLPERGEHLIFGPI